MSASITSIVKQGTTAYLYTWTGTSPFRIFEDGVLIEAASTGTTRIFEGDSANTPPYVEILDSTQTGDPDSVTYPPYFTLQWRGDTNSFGYRVDEYTGGQWVERSNIRESGAGYYKYQSPAYNDATATQHRVVAVDEDGNESTALEYTQTIIRVPQPVDATMAYSAGTGQVTFTAA